MVRSLRPIMPDRGDVIRDIAATPAAVEQYAIDCCPGLSRTDTLHERQCARAGQGFGAVAARPTVTVRMAGSMRSAESLRRRDVRGPFG